MTYGLMFWDNLSHAERVFKLQKRVVRFIKGCRYRDSCREHFRDMNILPLRSQYIYSLMILAIKNREIFTTNSDCYDHMAVTIYNGLPNKLKITSNNSNKFKAS
jgi:hypothetical protein